MTEEKLSVLSLSVRRDADAISQCRAMMSECVADKDNAGTERIALVLSAHCRELAGRVYGTLRATSPAHEAAVLLGGSVELDRHYPGGTIMCLAIP